MFRFVMAVVLFSLAFSATVATTEPALKAPWRGLVDRKGLPAEGWEKVIDNAVCNVDWKTIEPRKGEYDFSSVDTFLQKAQSRGIDVYLRLFAGTAAPEWLMQEAGAVQMGRAAAARPQKSVCWWKPEVGQAYRKLQEKLAERYDNDERVFAVTMSRCASVYAEPFIHQFSSAETRQNVIKAGYTNELDKAAQIETVQIHADTWKRTRSSIALNPYQTISAKGGIAIDNGYTLAFMDEAKKILGERLILQNNSLRPLDRLAKDYLEIYEKLEQMGEQETWIGFQTATMQKNDGRLKETLETAVKYGATFVELPSGYDSEKSAKLTRADLQAIDAALEKQSPGKKE